jgi:Domain of unknown function (DUF4189)
MLALAIASILPRPAVADGALAIGIPRDVAEDGFAYGYSTSKRTAAEARDIALDYCRTAQAASRAARKLCYLIANFRGECVAVAMDPKDNTPGVGWAIAVDKATAEERAMAFCRATAGEDRREFCKIDAAACDGEKN